MEESRQENERLALNEGKLYELEKCRAHCSAWKMGTPKLDSKRCDCCGARIQKQPLNACFGRDDVVYLGEGLILYFEFIKMTWILAFLATCVYSIPGIYFNYTSNGCIAIPALSCSGVFFTYFSVANRLNNFLQMKNQSYYLLAAAISMFLVIQIYRARFHSIEDHLERISGPQKYAVLASTENPDFTNEQIKKGIIDWWKLEYQTNEQYLKKQLAGKVPDFKTPKIQKVIRSYDIHVPKQIKDRLNQLFQEVQLIDNEEEANKVREQLILLKERAEQMDLKKNNKAVIIFSQEQYANYIVQRSSPSILFRACIRYERVRFGQQEVDMAKAPLPSEILWENHHLKGRQKVRNTIVIYVLTLAILFAAQAAVFGILYAWFRAEQTVNPAWESYISALVSLLIVLINSILYYLFIFMSKFQYHPIMMEDHISKCLKIIVAVFFNSGLMLLVAYYVIGITKLWESNGFVDTLSYSFLYVILTPHLIKYCGPGYICHFLRMARIKWGSPKYTQKQANRYYQKPQAFQVYHHYAWLVTWMWLASFFSPMMPLSYPCVFITFFIHFWLEKINYAYLYKQQKPWSSQLNYLMIQAMEISQFLLAIGNINVELALRTARGESLELVPILISIIIASVVAFHVLFVPKNLILRLFTCHYCLKQEKEPASYEQNKGKFLTSFEKQMKIYYDGRIDSQDVIREQTLTYIDKIANRNTYAGEEKENEKNQVLKETIDKPHQITQSNLMLGQKRVDSQND